MGKSVHYFRAMGIPTIAIAAIFLDGECPQNDTIIRLVRGKAPIVTQVRDCQLVREHITIVMATFPRIVRTSATTWAIRNGFSEQDLRLPGWGGQGELKVNNDESI